MDKNEKNKLSDLLFTVTMWSYNKRFEILECRLQVQTARIDELIGPPKEPAKKPVKRA